MCDNMVGRQRLAVGGRRGQAGGMGEGGHKVKKIKIKEYHSKIGTSIYIMNALIQKPL